MRASHLLYLLHCCCVFSFLSLSLASSRSPSFAFAFACVLLGCISPFAIPCFATRLPKMYARSSHESYMLSVYRTNSLGPLYSLAALNRFEFRQAQLPSSIFLLTSDVARRYLFSLLHARCEHGLPHLLRQNVEYSHRLFSSMATARVSKWMNCRQLTLSQV